MEMTLSAALHAPHHLPHSTSSRPRRALCHPAKLRFKKSPQGGCHSLAFLNKPPPFCVPVPPQESISPLIASRRSSSSLDEPISRREAALQLFSGAGGVSAAGLACWAALVASSPAAAAVDDAESRPRPKFYDLDGSGGVKALDIREGTGATPKIGDKVAIHYYARLAAKQGWRFDSSYDHKDQSGAPEPFVFVIGDGTVIAGLDNAVRSMKEGGVRRAVIPPSQGYQNTTQGPIPPNFSDRQRLYTTIFNPTRLANGEGATLGILVFDIELLGIRPT